MEKKKKIYTDVKEKIVLSRKDTEVLHLHVVLGSYFRIY